MIINYLKIYGLFGKFNIEIDLREKTNILAGANGVGKSTALKILQLISECDFVSILQYKFNHITVLYESIDCERELTFTRDNLVPSYESLVKSVVEYYLTIFENDDDRKTLEGLKTFDDYLTNYKSWVASRWIELSRENGWLTDLLYASFCGGKQVADLIQSKHSELYRVNGAFDLCPIMEKLYNKDGMRGHIRYFKESEIYSILTDKHKMPESDTPMPFYKKMVEKNLRYLDLVPSFSFTDFVEEPLYEMPFFRWLDAIRKQKDTYLDSGYDYYENWNIGIPVNIFRMDEDAFTKAWSSILDSLPPISATDKYSAAEKIDGFINDRVFDLNGLIARNYYEIDFVDDINKEYVALCKKLIETDAYYELDGAIFDIIDEDDMNNYRDLFIEEYVESRSEYRQIIQRYFIPVIADPAFRFELNDDSYDRVRIMSYIKLTEKLTNPENRSSKIGLFEKAIKKYLATVDVEIYPYGIELKSKFNGDRIDLNSLSSGEKKIIMLLAVSCFMDDMIFLFDEPELSLSIVWQKSIIKDMLSFNTVKNLTIATQSPFLSMDEEVQQYIRYLPQEEYEAE